MEQHQIPQQISSYEFKLVGEMTLKQFGKAAGGVAIAMLINASKLVFFVKWPLVFLFGAGGLALAFLPYEDRPLDAWIGTFLKAFYSPTIYLYRKKARENWLEIDKAKTEAMEVEEEAEEKAVKKDKVKVKEFIESLPSIKREREKAGTAKEEIEVEQPGAVVVEKKETKEETEEGAVEVDWRLEEAKVKIKPSERLMATGKANFGAIPMPDIPELPNLVVGMVMGADGKIIDGAIVEILDENGNPSRVLKTNSLGQFRTSAQLANGKYLVVPEKEGFNFDRVGVDLRGQIVQPIRIIANA